MHVLLYVIDALRADHLSCYGYNRPTTPNIDQLAKESVAFENCHSPSTWTKPVAASILTGVYPPVHGVQRRSDVFASGVPSLPELLTQNGARTAGFSAMGNVSSAFGFSKGFDEYHDLYKDPTLTHKRRTSSAGEEKLPHEANTPVVIPLAEDLNNAVFPWLEYNTPQDFFVFMWSIDPHSPYDPPKTFRRFANDGYRGKIDGSRDSIRGARSDSDIQHLMDLYDSEIYYNDYCIGQLISFLRDLGIYDQTMVIILGDHGDAFGEHGFLSHGHLPYDEVTHVPLIIKFPQSAHAGVRIPALVSLVDIMPTVIDCFDLELDDTLGASIQGRSLMPLIHGETKCIHDYIYSVTGSTEFQPTFYAVRTDKWKYIHVQSPRRNTQVASKVLEYGKKWRVIRDFLLHPRWFINRYIKSAKPKLLNLQADPAEKQNVIREHPEVAERLHSVLLNWLRTCQEISNHRINSGTGALDDDQAIIEHLRALGYID